MECPNKAPSFGLSGDGGDLPVRERYNARRILAKGGSSMRFTTIVCFGLLNLILLTTVVWAQPNRDRIQETLRANPAPC